MTATPEPWLDAGDVIALGALFVTLVIFSLTLILNSADYRLRVYGERGKTGRRQGGQREP